MLGFTHLCRRHQVLLLITKSSPSDGTANTHLEHYSKHNDDSQSTRAARQTKKYQDVALLIETHSSSSAIFNGIRNVINGTPLFCMISS